ncbi:MAG: 16S rRNA processing protein RimM [Saprospirales bacterium]|nr:16S rRNA processing protein RimM [Saprospirales bacterium]
MSEYVQIGFTQKTHGVEGELRIFIEDNYVEDFLDSDALFIGVSGQIVPYFIEYIRGANDDILKLEDVASKEEAQKLTSSPVYLREADLTPEINRDSTPYAPQYEYLEGFEAVDKEKGSLGPILRVEEFPHQEMAVVSYQGREALVPLHDQIIDSIDKKKKVIRFILPEGLLDL